MSISPIQNKIVNELDFIPESKLSEVYDWLHRFRLKVNPGSVNVSKNLLGDEFAGKWKGPDTAGELINMLKHNQTNQ